MQPLEGKAAQAALRLHQEDQGKAALGDDVLHRAVVLPQREDLPDEGAAVAGAGRGLAAAQRGTTAPSTNIATA